MDTSNTRQVIELNAQGAEYHQHGKLSKAADCYRRALQIDPDNATCHNNLGFLLAQQHQWKDALSHLRRAITLVPDNASFLGNLGQVLVKMGMTRDGLEMLLKAAELEPKSIQVWENLARLYSNLDDPAGAESAWKQARQIKPQDACLITELASTIAQQQRFNEAVLLYRQALEINPDYADAWVQLGVSLFLQQEYDEAREVLQKALSLDTANYSALRHLGYVFTSLGNREKALESFRALLNYYPDADSVRLDLSVLLLSDNQNQAAHEQLEFLYKRNSHNDRVIFYYGLSLYRIDDLTKAFEIWLALENSDSPYRSKIAEFAKG